MKVTPYPDQENISRESIADLEQLLKTATANLRVCASNERAATTARINAANEVSEIQKRFDRECGRLREEAVYSTYWSDTRRCPGEDTSRSGKNGPPG